MRYCSHSPSQLPKPGIGAPWQAGPDTASLDRSPSFLITPTTPCLNPLELSLGLQAFGILGRTAHLPESAGDGRLGSDKDCTKGLKASPTLPCLPIDE